MRTKTLVLSAVVGLVGSVAAMAQSVYSLNAVGYVNTVVPSGFSIIANPLNAATNKLSTIIPTAPEGTQVYQYNGTTFVISTFAQNDDGVNVWDPDLSLAPGEGFWIRNAGTTAFTNTFVGEVPTGTLTSAIPVGFSLKSSIVPQAGDLQADLGFPAAEGDAVYVYDTSIKNFVISTWGQDDNGVWGWDIPVSVKVGQGFWVLSHTAKTWTRTFTLN